MNYELYGLIGEKLGHSFSKWIHEKLADYTYNLLPLSKEEFKTFMNEKNFSAINVTIPYKMDVIPYLDEIDTHAKTIGAVNTIVNFDGKLHGYNTDFSGFLYLLQHNSIDVYEKKVLVLGKGGASKAIIAVLNYLGAKEILTVYYKNSPDTVTYEECKKNHSDADVIINTTPVGMYPNIDNSPIDLNDYKKCSAVVDVIYNPIRPMLIVQAQNLGIKAIGGLEMLIAQAKYAVEIFQNRKIADTEIQRIYEELLLERSNLVLIGMPSCGKTAIGEELSKKTGKKMVDIDAEIVNEIGMSIPEYFSRYGEEAFRKKETEVTKRVSKENGIILSTGGGCIKNPVNIDYMKLNGRLIFIERDIESLSTDDSRPLSKDKESLQKLYQERLPLYKKYSEASICNDGTLEKAVEMLEKIFLDHLKKNS